MIKFTFSTRKILINLSFFLIICTLSYLSAERFLGIDRDYYQYLYFYDTLASGYEGRFELGFVILTFLIRSMFNSFWGLLFSVSLLSLSIKFYILSKLPKSFFWIFLYFLILYPVHEMTQMRVAIALGLGYLSLYFAQTKPSRFVPVLMLAIAALFHWTILIFIPFTLFWQKFTKHGFTLTAGVIVIPAAFMSLLMSTFTVFNPQVMRMIELANEMEANPFSSRNIVFLSIIFIGFYNINKFPNNILPWFYLSLMGISLWYGLMSVPVFAHRLLELTIFSYFMWIPFLPKFSRLISMGLFLILAVYLFINAIYFDPMFGA